MLQKSHIRSATVIRCSALALWAFTASAAALAAATPDDTLTVHGHAEIMTNPDVAYATLAVTTQSPQQNAAVTANAKSVRAVISALHRDQITDKDIQTQYVTVQPQYSTGDTPVRTGFQVQNAIRITIGNLEKAGQILDDATKAGATDVSSLSFDLADRSRVEGQALVAAVANARSKADLLAGAAGVDIGRVTSLTEGTPPDIMPVVYNGLAMKRDDSTPVQSQQITVAADVTISYSITPTQR